MATEAVRRAGRWSVLVLAVACAAWLVYAFAPLTTTTTCYESSEQVGGCSTSSRSLAATEGAEVLAIGLIPAVVAAIPVVYPARWTRRGIAILFTLLVFAAGSVGLFLIPIAVLAWIASVPVAGQR